MVSDPCYELDTWCQYELENVQPGSWSVFKTTSDEEFWGIRVAEFEAYIGEIPKDDEYELVEEATIGVDSGQAGFFESTGYRNMSLFGKDKPVCHPMFLPEDVTVENYQEEYFYGVCCNITLNDQAGVFPGGAVSTSGFGDGSYDLFVRKNQDGKITALKLVFISDEEEEEDY